MERGVVRHVNLVTPVKTQRTLDYAGGWRWAVGAGASSVIVAIAVLEDRGAASLVQLPVGDHVIRTFPYGNGEVLIVRSFRIGGNNTDIEVASLIRYPRNYTSVRVNRHAGRGGIQRIAGCRVAGRIHVVGVKKVHSCYRNRR